MKKVLFFTMVFLPFVVFSQKPFTINGNVKHLKNGDKVYLGYKSEGKIISDSAIVSGGKFSFKGTLNSPAKGNLYLNKNLSFVRPKRGEYIDRLTLYIEPRLIEVVAIDSLSNADILGSQLNNTDKKLSASTKQYVDEMLELNSLYMKLSNDEKKTRQPEFAGKYNGIQRNLKNAQLAFIKTNMESYVSLETLGSLVSDPVLFADVERTYESMSTELKSTPAGQDILKTIVTARKTALGAIAPDFTQNDVNDKAVKLSDFRGKYVLLDFWASWCGPCRAENPNVVKAFNTYKEKNFTVLGVSLDQPGKKDLWLAAIEKDRLVWTQVSDLKYWGNEAAKLYNITGIPANYLIDPNGKIIAKDIRGEELDSKLASIFGSKTR